MVLKKIEKTYGFMLNEFEIQNMTKITIIGAGGNGSHVISDVARLVASLKKDIEIVLVDGDQIEEKNLIRQHFVKSDLGKNKAEALALRYGSAYNVNISFVPEFLTVDNVATILPNQWSPGPQLVITCTDNLKSRKLVEETCQNHIWIDLGNEEFGGQVTFTCLMGKLNHWYKVKYGSETHAIPTPTVFELFPDYLTKMKTEKPVTEVSCAEIAEASPAQAGFVNVMAAAIAKNFVHAVLTGREIRTYQVFFTIDNTFEHRTITQNVVEKWIKDFPRFVNYTM